MVNNPKKSLVKQRNLSNLKSLSKPKFIKTDFALIIVSGKYIRVCTHVLGVLEGTNRTRAVLAFELNLLGTSASKL